MEVEVSGTIGGLRRDARHGLPTDRPIDGLTVVGEPSGQRQCPPWLPRLRMTAMTAQRRAAKWPGARVVGMEHEEGGRGTPLARSPTLAASTAIVGRTLFATGVVSAWSV